MPGLARLDGRADPLEPFGDLLGRVFGGAGVGDDQLQLRAPRERLADPKPRCDAGLGRGGGALADQLRVTRLRPQRDALVHRSPRREQRDQQREPGDGGGDDHAVASRRDWAALVPNTTDRHGAYLCSKLLRKFNGSDGVAIIERMFDDSETKRKGSEPNVASKSPTNCDPAPDERADRAGDLRLRRRARRQ